MSMADGCHGEQAKGRERGVAAAHVGFAVDDGTPMILAGNVLELGVRVGDCDKARAGALGTQVSADVLPAHVREHGWLERGSRLARHDVERACRVRRSEDVIDVDRRERVHRLERDLVSDFEAVELGDRLRACVEPP